MTKEFLEWAAKHEMNIRIRPLLAFTKDNIARVELVVLKNGKKYAESTLIKDFISIDSQLNYLKDKMEARFKE